MTPQLTRPQPHHLIPLCRHACLHTLLYMSTIWRQARRPGSLRSSPCVLPALRYSITPAKIMSHIAVERNRRRQMNENLKVLRSLTPSFYIKRGDQASIIGGAIEFIKELQLVLQSLEAKKKRKRVSPSPSPSPRPPSLQPLTPSPPTTSTTATSSGASGPHDSDGGCGGVVKELGACCNSPVADVEVKLSGPNVLLRTLSKRHHGQVVKIVTLLERQEFEVLHLNISSMDDTVLYSFLIKIGLECQLSVEELAFEVQRSFCEEIG